MLSIQTSERWRPEKEYTFQVLFQEMLGIAYRLEFQNMEGHQIQLPNRKILYVEDWFSNFDRPGLDFFRQKFSESVLLSPQAQGSANAPLPDLFAAAFFMLARWEETQVPERDLHGRFAAQKSLAWQIGFLQRPVVNEWADMLWGHLARLGWPGKQKRRKFQISLSCDVDHPRLWWSAADRAKTLAGAVFNRRSMVEAGFWLKRHAFHKKDPYDVFDEWLEMFERNGVVAQFNFMGKRPRSSDCWYPHAHPFVKNLMEKIAAKGHSIGFHPSYESLGNPDFFDRELHSLREISPIEISGGRQHYLRFSVPQTWQVWERAGLREDSTLGYPEAEGFRCGICHDFPVFDTLRRKTLNLREKPLIAMDVSLAHYRHYTPAQAAERLVHLRSTVEKHGGDFTLLWHNSSWNTPFWVDWKPVLKHLIAG